MSVLHPSLRVKFNKDFKKVNNSEFVEGTALIAYSGDNQNSSDITEQAFEDAMPSLGLIPLVGHWLPDKQNFGGHDITIEWSGNELVLKDNTVPYGVVKENHNAEWLEIEEDGEVHKYIKADVVLWYARYPEPVQKVIDTGVNQSMEINIKDYSEKTSGNIQINSFEYSALCLLGLDIDENGNKGEDNIDPCFESASVVVDKFTVNNKFKEQFNQLLFALNNNIKIDSYFISKDKAEQLVQKANTIFFQLGFECSEYIVDGKEYQITGIINKTLNEEATNNWGFPIYNKDTITIYSLDFETIDTASISISSVELLMNKNNNTDQQHFTLKIKEVNKEGGNELVDENKIELLSKYNLTVEQLDFNLDDFTVEELDEKLKEFSVDSVKDTEIITTFSATYNQKREALRNALDPIIVRDAENKIIEETYFWVSDFDDEFVYVEKDYWGKNDSEFSYGRVKYTFDEIAVTATVDMSSWEKMIKVWLTEAENQKIQEERTNLTAEFESLKNEFEEYKNNYSTLNSEVIILQEFKSNTEKAQQEAFELQQSQLKTELIENFSKVLSAEEIKSITDKNLSIEDMETEFKLIFASKELSTKFSKKTKKPEVETEIPIVFTKKTNNDSWTSCIKK